MDRDRDRLATQDDVKQLDKAEIDRRIQAVLDDVMDLGEYESPVSARESAEPQWIPAAELVRRMRPFIVYN